jgi:hypothetical protein
VTRADSFGYLKSTLRFGATALGSVKHRRWPSGRMGWNLNLFWLPYDVRLAVVQNRRIQARQVAAELAIQYIHAAQ